MKVTTDRMPPQTLDVEVAVLGALLLESDAINKVSGILDAVKFYKSEHRIIFEAIKRLSDSSKPIDLLTVTIELKRTGKLEEVGGPYYITQLTSQVASASHIEHHARIILQSFIQREIIRMASVVSDSAFNGDDIETILSNLKWELSNIENYSNNPNDGGSQFEVCNNAIIEIENDCQKAKDGQLPGITSGLKELDFSTGGWRNTNLIVMASRPGVGKTSLALHFAKMASMAGYWVNFYSLEMKKEDLFRIVLSGESGVNRSDIRDGTLTEADWIPINKAVTSLENLPIIWYDFAGITPAQIKSNTARNRKNNRCDLVIIDYLQLVSPTDKKAIREQQIAEMSRTFKGIALNENIPVLCLSQLNREATNETPQLHHLRESGAIEQDADIVLFPYRNKNDDSYSICVAKNRRGRVGEFEIYANEEMTVFSNKVHQLTRQTEAVNYYEPEPF